MRNGIMAGLLVAAMFTPAAHAQSGAEQLLRPQAKGYVQGFEHTQPNGGRMWEYVPAGQTVQNWTEMLTVNASPPTPQMTPRQYLAFIEQGWMNACPGASNHWIIEGEENGYPFAVLQLTCPNNPQSGKPEYTWFKGIKGQEHFYVVQKAFRFEPAAAQVVQWVQYLHEVRVCNERDARHPCPAPAAAPRRAAEARRSASPSTVLHGGGASVQM